MPYRINWGKRRVTFEYFGTVSAEDILESNQSVYGDERFDSLRWQVVCFDETESIAFTPDSIRVVAYMDRGAAISNANISVLFVGESDVLSEVERCYSKVNGERKWPIKTFPTREQALQWIEAASPYHHR